jgi:hypothetical protein
LIELAISEHVRSKFPVQADAKNRRSLRGATTVAANIAQQTMDETADISALRTDSQKSGRMSHATRVLARILPRAGVVAMLASELDLPIVGRQSGNIMGSNDYTAIVREFTRYIVNFVEQPKPEMGNLPVCPFARKARLNNRMRIEVVELSLDAVMARVSSFTQEPKLDVVICVHPQRDGRSCTEVYRLAEELNQLVPALNLLALAGHPDDPFNIDGLYTRREPYPNIQLLRLDVGERAYKSIENSGYYQRWTEENFLIPGWSPKADPQS